MAQQRGRETVADMVRSLAVVGAVVAGLFLVVAWQRPEVQGSIRPPVDVAGLVAAVDATGPFPVLEPTGLPEGWQASSAWFEADVTAVGGPYMHLGYVTPGGSYAEVRQTDGDRDRVVAEWADHGSAQPGTVELAGLRWQRLVSETTGKRALVATDPTGSSRVVVLVTGKAGWPELETLAGSLR
jgi:Protein of unknown function (DUF4245)